MRRATRLLCQRIDSHVPVYERRESSSVVLCLFRPDTTDDTSVSFVVARPLWCFGIHLPIETPPHNLMLISIVWPHIDTPCREQPVHKFMFAVPCSCIAWQILHRDIASINHINLRRIFCNFGAA